MPKEKKPQAAGAAERALRELFTVGDMVRLESGRTVRLIRRVPDAVPPGWVIEGEIGVVAEWSLTPLEEPQHE